MIGLGRQETGIGNKNVPPGNNSLPTPFPKRPNSPIFAFDFSQPPKEHGRSSFLYFWSCSHSSCLPCGPALCLNEHSCLKRFLLSVANENFAEHPSWSQQNAQTQLCGVHLMLAIYRGECQLRCQAQGGGKKTREKRENWLQLTDST